MISNRRKFLRSAGAFSAGALLLPQFACNNSNSQASADASGEGAAATETPQPSIQQFGLQLYTLRDEMPKDPKGILKQVASFGYQQIEGYEGDMGMETKMKRLNHIRSILDLQRVHRPREFPETTKAFKCCHGQ